MTAELPANGHDEPANTTALLGFRDGIPAGVWYRQDIPGEPTDPRRWWSTYIAPTPTIGGYGHTWQQAQALGASWAHELWTSPTPDAYAAACRALDTHRAEVDRLRTILADHGITDEEANR